MNKNMVFLLALVSSFSVQVMGHNWPKELEEVKKEVKRLQKDIRKNKTSPLTKSQMRKRTELLKRVDTARSEVKGELFNGFGRVKEALDNLAGLVITEREIRGGMNLADRKDFYVMYELFINQNN